VSKTTSAPRPRKRLRLAALRGRGHDPSDEFREAGESWIARGATPDEPAVMSTRSPPWWGVWGFRVVLAGMAFGGWGDLGSVLGVVRVLLGGVGFV